MWGLRKILGAGAIALGAIVALATGPGASAAPAATTSAAPAATTSPGAELVVATTGGPSAV
jgi:hypothetical protein